ncbi:MAG: SHOCT domain-containing protein [Bacilli bacterium]|jgi:uncharacterized membrane protein|nr:SHOCT domain-containing protein [Bacilli bacterium]
MKIAFKKDSKYFYVAILAFVIQLIFVIISAAIYSSVNHTRLTIYSSSLSLAIMVLLIIADKVEFKDPRIPTVMNLISYFFAIFSVLTLSSKNAQIADTNFAGVVNSLDSVLLVISWVLSAFSFLFIAVLVISSIIFICGKNTADILRIIKISGILLLVSSSLAVIIQALSMMTGVMNDNAQIVLYIGNLLTQVIFAVLILLLTRGIEINNSVFIPQSGNKPSDPEEELRKAKAIESYKDLLDRGVITQEEFEKKKKQILEER